MTSAVASFKAAGLAGFSVAFSPFPENMLAVAYSQHFGIVGNGRLVVLSPPSATTMVMPQQQQQQQGGGEQQQQQQMGVVTGFDTQDSMFDVCWSETNRQHVLAACGDGSVKLFDLVASPAAGGRPLRVWAEHNREVNGVHWNLVHKGTFVTASWDDTVKVWSPDRAASLITIRGHRNCAYAAVWSPYAADMIASAGGDGTVMLWDARSPTSTPTPAATISGHSGEVLTVDWNKYNENILASGSVDRTIRIWDIRAVGHEVACLSGHQFAVRRVKWSPFSEHLIASASYDLTARVWDPRAMGQAATLDVFDRHTEFVVGLDWSLNLEHQLATCSWDESVCVFVPRCLQQQFH